MIIRGDVVAYGDYESQNQVHLEPQAMKIAVKVIGWTQLQMLHICSNMEKATSFDLQFFKTINIKKWHICLIVVYLQNQL